MLRIHHWSTTWTKWSVWILGRGHGLYQSFWAHAAHVSPETIHRQRSENYHELKTFQDMISICQFRFGLPSLKPCSGKWYRPWVPDSSWLIQIVPIHTTNMDPGWFLKALLHGKESPQKTTPLPICRANTPSSCSHRWCQPARIGQLCGAHVDSWLCSPDPTRYLIKTVPSFMASWFSLSTPSKGFLKLSGSFCCIAPDSMTFFRNNP